MFNFPEHRSFDGMVAINDSNWYIKPLNYIEIDKQKAKKQKTNKQTM